MNKIIAVDKDRVSGLQKDLRKKSLTAEKYGDGQFFDGLEALLKADRLQKEIFIEKVLKRKSSLGTFVVEEVFLNSNKDFLPVSFCDDCELLVLERQKERIVSINAFGQNILKEYLLSRHMNDTKIQEVTKSMPMGEEAFWAMFYLLIINPKLGKKILKYELCKDKIHIFHIRIPNGIGRTKVVNLSWEGKQWHLTDDKFNGFPWWNRNGAIFLFPSSSVE